MNEVVEKMAAEYDCVSKAASSKSGADGSRTGSVPRTMLSVITDLGTGAMDSGRFSRVVVVDSIPPGEYNTAKKLHEDLRVAVPAYSPTPSVEYHKVNSSAEFFDLLMKLRREVEGGAAIPALHLECHGSTDGLMLADGAFLEWSLLKAPLTELNVATQLNLFITVAACVGGALAKVITMGDRAPYWGLIGPTKNMSAGELEDSYRALYSTFFKTKSAQKAVDALNATASAGIYWRTTAQGLFEKSWKEFEATHATSPSLTKRAQALIATLPQELIATQQLTVEALAKRMADAQPKLYRRYVETFFMCDLYPEHRQRFAPSTMQHAE